MPDKSYFYPARQRWLRDDPEVRNAFCETARYLRYSEYCERIGCKPLNMEAWKREMEHIPDNRLPIAWSAAR